MTTVEITLPDRLAEEAERQGLLAPERIEHMLRAELRTERVARLRHIRSSLSADPRPPMTAEEIQAEIDAYRADFRRATGS